MTAHRLSATVFAAILSFASESSADECTGTDPLELAAGCSVLATNEDFTLRLHAPEGADLSTAEGIEEALNRSVIFLHGYGVADTTPPSVFYEDGGEGRFADLHATGISVVAMAPGTSKTDRVEDDAAAARSALELLNAYRGTDAMPWIVFGHSMGGLMARIALAGMEADSAEHNVALYISYDSPHSGVHVPQGMQQLKLKLDEWAAMTEEDFITVDEDWEGVFNLADVAGMKTTLDPNSVSGFPDPTSMQAQQMTIQGVALPEAYPAFMTLLADTGFPEVRSIAVSNGNTQAIANTQEVPAGGELFFFSGAKGNSFASVRGVFEVFTDKPGAACFKSEVFYDGVVNSHLSGGRRDATTREDIVLMDALSGSTLDYANEMLAAATAARRDFHNPEYRGAANSAIPFVPTSSAFALPVDTADADIAGIVGAEGTPFDDVMAMGNLDAFPSNLDHNTLVLSDALLEDIHSLLPCREGIDVLGCVEEEPEEEPEEEVPDAGVAFPAECPFNEVPAADGGCEPAPTFDEPVACGCGGGAWPAGLWLSLLGFAAVRWRVRGFCRD